MTTTNGHPTLKPGDLAPERRPVKRTLYVEEETDVGREAIEITGSDDDRELMRELGWVRVERAYSEAIEDAVRRESGSASTTPDGWRLERSPQNGETTLIMGTTPSGEAVRMVNGDGDAKACAECHGTGRVPVGGAAWGTVERDARCGECGGTGRVEPKDEPVRMVGAERAEVELPRQKPSEWIIELAKQNAGPSAGVEDYVAAVMKYLDECERERLGRGGA